MSELVDEGQTLHFRFDFFSALFSRRRETFDFTKVLLKKRKKKKKAAAAAAALDNLSIGLENRNNLMRSI